jgi:anti-anti-sigma factor
MSFSLVKTAEESNGIVRLAAQGDALASTHDSNPFPFESILGPSWNSRLVILDMNGVNYLNSSAIGWLISLQKTFRAAGGKLVLHSLQPQIHQLLTMLKIERLIPLAPDLAAARKQLPQAATA